MSEAKVLARDEALALPRVLALIALGSAVTLFLLRDRALAFSTLPAPTVSAGVSYDPAHPVENIGDGHWIEGNEFLFDRVPDGSRISFTFAAPPLTDSLEIGFTSAHDHGIFEVQLDGHTIGQIDQRRARVEHDQLRVATPRMGGGEHHLELVVKANDKANDGPLHLLAPVFHDPRNNGMGLDALTLRAATGPGLWLKLLALLALLASLGSLLTTRFRHLAISIVLSGLGTLILISIVPHAEPFRSRAIDTPNAGALVSLRLLPQGAWLTLPKGSFLAGTIVLISLLLVAHCLAPTGRLVRRPSNREWAGLLLILPIIACTLLPRAATWPMVVYQLIGAIAILLIALGVAWGAPEDTSGFPSWLLQLARWPARAIFNPPPIAFGAAIFLLTAGIATALSLYLFQGVPHVIDSVVQLFHARVFATGHLMSQIPLQREFFDTDFMITKYNDWYSKYPPGHIAMLALGVLAGTPFLVNPLLGAGTVLLIYLLARDLWGECTGRIAGLLGLCSPFILFMSSEYMNHATALFSIMLFIHAYRRVTNSGGLWWGAIAGFALGLAAATRPLSALAMSIPFAIDLLSRMRKSTRSTIEIGLSLTLSAAVPLTLFLLFNWKTNGSPFLSGYEKLHGANHNPGFGHSAWGLPHTAAMGFQSLATNLATFNKALFEWPLPALALVLFGFVPLPGRRWEWLLLAAAASLGLAYVGYWYSDLCFGPRMFYEASGPIILLTAKVLADLPQALAPRWGRLRSQLIPALAVLVCLTVAAVGHMPPMIKMFSNHYWAGDGRVIAEVQRQHISNAIVFINPSSYHSAFAMNDPSFEGPVIYARDTSHNWLLRRQYPERSCFVERDHLPVPCPSDDGKSLH